MSWEGRNGRGRYYTRSKRCHGRITREYIGTGKLAELIAEADKFERQQRHAELIRAKEHRAEEQSLEAALDEFCRLTDVAAHAMLAAAGYHEHKGQWRKERHGKT
jgi:hypothetical protein